MDLGAVRYKTELVLTENLSKRLLVKVINYSLSTPLQFNEKDMKVCSYYTYDLTNLKSPMNIVMKLI